MKITKSRDTNVVQMPGVRKHEQSGAMLEPPVAGSCQHLTDGFTVDVDASKCFCRACGQVVGPYFVLEQLMRDESRWRRSHEAMERERAKLAERQKIKCAHCGKFTNIGGVRSFKA